MSDAPVHIITDPHYASGMLKPLPNAPSYPAPQYPKDNMACSGSFSNLSFCDTSKAPAERASELVNMLTVSELLNAMDHDVSEVKRLGVPAYRYGREGLHGVVMPCIEPGQFEKGGRCFTDFPSSSAAAAAFNRSLWWHIGAAQSDEARGMFNDGYLYVESSFVL
jgi:beta-glucosidase-like glycosyl hydrolase